MAATERHITTAHTAHLDAATLDAAHALVAAAFEGDFDEHDWEHALGGMHALAYDGGELVGHASVVQRRMLYAGRALRAGYVEAVAVRADRRRRGHGAALMDALERVIRRAYDLGALGATDDGAALYTPRGWLRWEGPASTLAPTGPERTPEEDGCIYVLPVALELDRSAALACDWRDGDVW